MPVWKYRSEVSIAKQQEEEVRKKRKSCHHLLPIIGMFVWFGETYSYRSYVVCCTLDHILK